MMRFVLATMAALVAAGPLAAAEEPTLVPDCWLVLSPVDARTRTPFSRSRVFARYLLERGSPAPHEGEVVRGEHEAGWQRREPGDGGMLDARDAAWAHAVVDAPHEGVWLAEIKSAALIFVNGDAICGDVYGHGIARHPVRLRAGRNEVYAAGFRGAFRVRFVAPEADVFVADYDATLPDLVEGEPITPHAAVVVVNATTRTIRPASVEGSLLLDESTRGGGTRLPSLPPLGEAKVPLTFPSVRAAPDNETARLEVQLSDCDAVLHDRTFTLDVRAPGEAYRRTFVSDIDGSVQFYGVLPPAPRPTGAPEVDERLVLTLHGASVDALGQARAYGARPGFWIIAPTNRRPFGFDWQDWGRLDAYEVLADALAFTHVAREDVHLTGHSMGGHGTLHLAANDPDGFASAAPSAGWVSFASYGGVRHEGPHADLWRRSDPASDTLALVENLAQVPIYQLHGTADDNVPVTEAAAMAAALEKTGDRYRVHYREGAGHWWDGTEAAGADCVDWPPIFELFDSTRLPTAPERIAFATVDPAIDHTHHWIRVEQALVEGEVARVRARREGHTILVETENVRHLGLTPPSAWRIGRVEIDGRHVEGGSSWRARRTNDGWTPAGAVSVSEKSASRKGPFKRVFDRRFVLVHGTAGTGEEDHELLARARYDAQRWRYRANGFAEVVSDAYFVGAPDRYLERNVVLYGNATTNAAWDTVFPESMPLRFERGRVRVGKKILEGENLAGYLVYPRRGSSRALAGAIADTGAAGTRSTILSRYFHSGVGYPDYVVFSSEVLRRGEAGFRAAGFFDHVWRRPEDD